MLGGDGMVHLGVQAVAGTGTPLGIIPAGTGNDVARYFDLPAQGPGRRRRPGRSPGATRQVDLARSGTQVLRDRAVPPASTRSSTSGPTG